MNIRTWGTALCIGAAMSSGAIAQGYSDEDLAWAMEFAMHDAMFTMYHETGHMLIGELNLPVLGKEEDAADALAAIMMLAPNDDEIERHNALIDAADGWYFQAVNSTGEGIESLSYYSDHSLDIQRAYAMVCMMVGNDPESFAETADAYEMDADRQEGCAYTYAQAEDSWTRVLEEHAVVDEPGVAIEVIYEEAGDYEEFAEELQSRQLLENTAELVMRSYVLPGPVVFRAMQCGEANAYYYPGESEVVYCYELAEYMRDLYLTDILGAYSEEYVEDEEEVEEVEAPTRSGNRFTPS